MDGFPLLDSATHVTYTTFVLYERFTRLKGDVLCETQQETIGGRSDLKPNIGHGCTKTGMTPVFWLCRHRYLS